MDSKKGNQSPLSPPQSPRGAGSRKASVVDDCEVGLVVQGYESLDFQVNPEKGGGDVGGDSAWKHMAKGAGLMALLVLVVALLLWGGVLRDHDTGTPMDDGVVPQYVLKTNEPVSLRDGKGTLTVSIESTLGHSGTRYEVTVGGGTLRTPVEVAVDGHSAGALEILNTEIEIDKMKSGGVQVEVVATRNGQASTFKIDVNYVQLKAGVVVSSEVCDVEHCTQGTRGRSQMVCTPRAEWAGRELNASMFYSEECGFFGSLERKAGSKGDIVVARGETQPAFEEVYAIVRYSGAAKEAEPEAGAAAGTHATGGDKRMQRGARVLGTSGASYTLSGGIDFTPIFEKSFKVEAGIDYNEWREWLRLNPVESMHIQATGSVHVGASLKLAAGVEFAFSKRVDLVTIPGVMHFVIPVTPPIPISADLAIEVKLSLGGKLSVEAYTDIGVKGSATLGAKWTDDNKNGVEPIKAFSVKQYYTPLDITGKADVQAAVTLIPMLKFGFPVKYSPSINVGPTISFTNRLQYPAPATAKGCPCPEFFSIGNMQTTFQLGLGLHVGADVFGLSPALEVDNIVAWAWEKCHEAYALGSGGATDLLFGPELCDCKQGPGCNCWPCLPGEETFAPPTPVPARR